MSSWLNSIAPGYQSKGVAFIQDVGWSFQSGAAPTAAQCQKYASNAGGLSNMIVVRDVKDAQTSLRVKLGATANYCYFIVDNETKIRFRLCGTGDTVEGPSAQQSLKNQLDTLVNQP